MRRVIVATVVFFLVPGVALAGGAGWTSICPGFSGGTTVSMLDSCYTGTAHFAPAGMALTISNDGELPHTFTATDGTFDSGVVEPGEIYRLTIDEPGVVKVFCTLHGTADGSGMAGVLIVGEPTPEQIDAYLNLEVLRQAVLEKDQAVVTALDGHSRAIRDLRNVQASFNKALEEQMAQAEEQMMVEETEDEPVVAGAQMGPTSNGIWVPMMSGLAVGLALAVLLGSRRSHPSYQPQAADTDEVQPS